jgi:D-cysteine desulfhydrase
VTVVQGGSDLAAAMKAVADELEAEGRRGYVIPGGGSNALGALGYVACAEEILAQSFDMGLKLDHIVCASGSAGTHAGLLTGLVANNAQIPLTGVSVRRRVAEQVPLVHGLAQKTADLLGVSAPSENEVVVDDRWVGPGYSLPTEEMIQAVRTLARLEGVLLDPVYTGKAMAGLIGQVMEERYRQGENLLFLHTGGAPGLYAYRDVLAST